MFLILKNQSQTIWHINKNQCFGRIALDYSWFFSAHLFRITTYDAKIKLISICMYYIPQGNFNFLNFWIFPNISKELVRYIFFFVLISADTTIMSKIVNFTSEDNCTTVRRHTQKNELVKVWSSQNDDWLTFSFVIPERMCNLWTGFYGLSHSTRF